MFLESMLAVCIGDSIVQGLRGDQPYKSKPTSAKDKFKFIQELREFYSYMSDEEFLSFVKGMNR